MKKNKNSEHRDIEPTPAGVKDDKRDMTASTWAGLLDAWLGREQEIYRRMGPGDGLSSSKC